MELRRKRGPAKAKKSCTRTYRLTPKDTSNARWCASGDRVRITMKSVSGSYSAVKIGFVSQTPAEEDRPPKETLEMD